jgi:hypothetical protein
VFGPLLGTRRREVACISRFPVFGPIAIGLATFRVIFEVRWISNLLVYLAFRIFMSSPGPVLTNFWTVF